MGTNKFKKVLAWLLALSMALSSGSALAAKKKGSVEPTMPPVEPVEIEEEFNWQVLNEINLTTNYMQYLDKHKIEVIDGKIIVDTEEKFEVVAQYFYSLQEKNGAKNVNMIGLRDFIIAVNPDTDGKIKDSLAAQKKISYPFPNYLAPGQSKFTDFWNMRTYLNQELILSGKKSEMFTLLPIIFDNDSRTFIGKLEEYDRHYGTISAEKLLEGSKSPAETEQRIEEYGVKIKDVYNFLNNELSSFPVAFVDMPDGSQYLIHYAVEQFIYTIFIAGGSHPLSLMDFINSDSHKTFVFEKMREASEKSYGKELTSSIK